MKLFLILMFLCGLVTSPNAKEVPMWKGISKSKAQLHADKRLVATMNVLGKKKAISRGLQLGWNFVAKNQPDMAIKRFNQVWLIDPGLANVHWGFGVATHRRGDPLSVSESHFAKAHSLMRKADPALYADHGRMYQERGKNKQAISLFQKSLKINPKHRDAHVGMWLASKALDDIKTANKHRKLIGN